VEGRNRSTLWYFRDLELCRWKSENVATSYPEARDCTSIISQSAGGKSCTPLVPMDSGLAVLSGHCYIASGRYEGDIEQH
jgi:hypothetical protein